MKLRYTLLLALMIAPATFGFGQSVAKNAKWAKVEVMDIERRKDSIRLEGLIDFNGLRLARNEQLKVTPMIVAGRDSLALEPVYVRTKNRAREESRIRRFNTEARGEHTVADITVHHRLSRKHDPIKYSTSFRLEPWMRNANVVIKEELSGCCDSQVAYSAFGAIYTPVAPQLTYIKPDYDFNGVCYHEMKATVNFRVDKSNIEAQYEHNQDELETIYAFIEKVIGNPALKVQKFRLVGYASPEAPFDYNDRLSKRRVEALKDRLVKYNLPDSVFETGNVPEDWDSLRTWVAASNLKYKNEVVGIIDGTPEPDARDAKIKALDNGETYRILLEDAYPNLRRTVITACMDVMPLTVEQALNLLDNDPQMLSQRDVYMLNANLPVDSPEYARLYETTLWYFTSDPVMIINASSAAIRQKNLGLARTLLAKVADDPRSLNNMGILDALNGDYDMADEYFRNALAAGDPDADFNMQNTNRLELPAMK